MSFKMSMPPCVRCRSPPTFGASMMSDERNTIVRRRESNGCFGGERRVVGVGGVGGRGAGGESPVIM
jgi:hypothetical protein